MIKHKKNFIKFSRKFRSHLSMAEQYNHTIKKHIKINWKLKKNILLNNSTTKGEISTIIINYYEITVRLQIIKIYQIQLKLYSEAHL